MQTLHFYLDAVRQLPAILGKVVLWYITVRTAIGATVVYFRIKWGSRWGTGGKTYRLGGEQSCQLCWLLGFAYF
jgi:hypothetical protein